MIKIKKMVTAIKKAGNIYETIVKSHDRKLLSTEDFYFESLTEAKRWINKDSDSHNNMVSMIVSNKEILTLYNMGEKEIRYFIYEEQNVR